MAALILKAQQALEHDPQPHDGASAAAASFAATVDAASTAAAAACISAYPLTLPLPSPCDADDHTIMLDMAQYIRECVVVYM